MSASPDSGAKADTREVRIQWMLRDTHRWRSCGLPWKDNQDQDVDHVVGELEEGWIGCRLRSRPHLSQARGSGLK